MLFRSLRSNRSTSSGHEGDGGSFDAAKESSESSNGAHSQQQSPLATSPPLSSLPATVDPKLGMTKETFIQVCAYEKRLKLHEVACSWLNRRGRPLVGKHCHALGKRMLTTTNKFAERRYRPGMCHEPDPSRPFRVADHYNEMARCDPCLHGVERVSLHGSVSKTHLWSMLWVFKAGSIHWYGDADQGFALPDINQPDLMEHIEFGMHYKVIKWEGVRDFEHIVLQIMEEDNQDAAFSLPEDEICLAMKVFNKLGIQPELGRTECETIACEIMKSPANKWSVHEITRMYNFTRCETRKQLEFLSRFVATFGHPDVLVPSSDYLLVAGLMAPWVSTALLADQYTCDKDNCETHVLGRGVAKNWSKHNIQELKTIPDEIQEIDTYLGKVYQTYTATELKGTDRDDQTMHFCISRFMFRAGVVIRTSKLRENWRVEMSKLEKSIRKKMNIRDADVTSILAVHEGSQPTNDVKKVDKNVVEEEKSVRVNFDELGCVVDDTRKAAHTKGFTVGTEVFLIKGVPDSGLAKGTTGVITRIDDEIVVKWKLKSGTEKEILVEPDQIDVHEPEQTSTKPKQPKSTGASDDKTSDLPDGVPHISCPPKFAMEWVEHILRAALWNLYVTNAPTPESVRLVMIGAPSQLPTTNFVAMAATNLKIGDLKIFPFGKLVKDVPVDYEPYEATLLVEAPGVKEKLKYGCDTETFPCFTQNEKGHQEVMWFRLLGDPGVKMSMEAYRKEFNKKATRLHMKSIEVQIPTIPHVPSIRRPILPKQSTMITVKMKYLTNDKVIPAGHLLFA